MPRSNQACITTFLFVRYWIFSFDIWRLLELSDKQNHIFMETSSNSRNNNLKTRWATSKVELFKSKRDVWRKYRLFLDDVELEEVHMIHFLRGIFYTAISLSFRPKNLWSWFWKLPTCSWALFSTKERREQWQWIVERRLGQANQSFRGKDTSLQGYYTRFLSM